jgi:hypothetical protein
MAIPCRFLSGVFAQSVQLQLVSNRRIVEPLSSFGEVFLEAQDDLYVAPAANPAAPTNQQVKLTQ